MKEYLKNICNWLNNTQGYIRVDQANELFKMLEIKFDKTQYMIYYILSSFVECDMQEEFADFLMSMKGMSFNYNTDKESDLKNE